MRKIFVGGLPITTSQDSMRAHFSRYGGVQDSILMVDRHTGRSRGFGFVTMKEAGSVNKILAEEQVLDGKRVDCKPAVPRDQNTGEETVVNFRTRKMFVGGLPPDVTEAEFRMFFSNFGAIEDSVIMYDRETGRPRGFGFITFASDDAVENVLENYDNNFIRGKWVECKKATPRDYGGMMGGKMMFQPYMQPMMLNPYMNQYYEYPEPHPQTEPEDVTITYQADTEPETLQRDEEMRRKLMEILLVTPDSSSIATHPDLATVKTFT